MFHPKLLRRLVHDLLEVSKRATHALGDNQCGIVGRGGNQTADRLFYRHHLVWHQVHFRFITADFTDVRSIHLYVLIPAQSSTLQGAKHDVLPHDRWRTLQVNPLTTRSHRQRAPDSGIKGVSRPDVATDCWLTCVRAGTATLDRHDLASAVLRTAPSSQGARTVFRGRPVDRP